MQIVLKKIDEIIPNSKNAKKHPKDQIQKIADSIKAFGFKQPLVIDKDGNLMVGHGRLLAAKLLKLKELPCVVASDLSPEQIKAYTLADNKLNESDWDMELVTSAFKELSADLQKLTGFDLDLKDTISIDVNKKIGKTFEIVIECQNEKEQEVIFNEINKLGYKCRILNI